jgi:hypothetical protein
MRVLVLPRCDFLMRPGPHHLWTKMPSLFGEGVSSVSPIEVPTLLEIERSLEYRTRFQRPMLFHQ